jgi:hypothetical protein
MNDSSQRLSGIPRIHIQLMHKAIFLLALVTLVATCGPAAPSADVFAQYTGTTAGDLFGEPLAPAGDLNGDGHPDWLAGGTQRLTQKIQPGYVQALSGLGGEPLHTFHGHSGHDRFGTALISIEDVDGDGVREIAVGAPYANQGRPDAGSVYLFSGRTGSPLWTVHGERGGDGLGVALGPLGDLDQDGIPDLAVGALQPAMSPDRDAGPGYVLALSGATGEQLFLARGDEETRDFGRELAPLGDVDGDGLPDLAVSAPASQAVLYVSGRTGKTLQRLEDLGAGFGETLAATPDANGDTWPDLLVGAPLDSSKAPLAGAVHVFSGLDGSSLRVFRGTQRGERLGGSLAALNDLDADGIPEIAVARSGGGALRILSGAQGQELMRLEPTQEQHDFGAGLASAGSESGQHPPHLAVGFPGIGPKENSSGGLLIVVLKR